MNHVVLLGDSIFENAAYVHRSPDVITQLNSILPQGWKATLLTVDGSISTDVIGQIRKIPESATHLVVSAGGNDGFPRQISFNDQQPQWPQRLNKGIDSS